MIRMKLKLLACVSLYLLSQANISGQSLNTNSWLQFRGNERNGVSTETNLLEKWPVDGPEKIWEKEIGEGFSEILISNEMLFTLSGEMIDSLHGFEYAVALDKLTGNEIWKVEIDSIFIEVDGWGNGARSTPVVDENNLYCLSGTGKFIALSKNNGKALWKVDFVKELGSTVPRWGFSTSPLLLNDKIIIEVGGTESRAFVAFDKTSGNVLWTRGTAGSVYCSPIKVKIEGQEQILFINGSELISYNAEGDTLWSFNMPLRSPTAVPVFIQPNKIFISTVSPNGSLMLQIVNNEVTQIFNTNTLQNHWSSSCYYDGYIYGFNVATLQCISVETGEKKWTKRGFGKGSLIIADNKLLVLSDRGKLIMVDANPETFTVLGSFQALNGRSWTAPSFADGKIFLRNHTEIACYKLK